MGYGSIAPDQIQSSPCFVHAGAHLCESAGVSCGCACEFSQNKLRLPDLKLYSTTTGINNSNKQRWVPEKSRRRKLDPLKRSKESGGGGCSSCDDDDSNNDDDEEEEEQKEELASAEELCELRGKKKSGQLQGAQNNAPVEKDDLRNKGLLQSQYRIVALLKACARLKDLHRGSRIHADIVRKGILEKNVFLGSALVSMYTKCGSLAKAQEVFDNLPIRNVVSWNTLIAGYTQFGQGEQAIRCFNQMQLEGLIPDAFTFACILKACGIMRAADKGKEIHDEIVRKGLLEHDVVICNSLVDMYAKCNLLAKAQDVFDKLSFRDVVTWNVLIAGYVQHGHGEQALQCFCRMQLEGISPDAVTYICSLKACGSIGAVDKGKELHTEIVRGGLFKEDTVVGTALIDMYAKCGLLIEARELFNNLPVRDVVAWNAIIAGYAQHGHGEQALKCFDQMQREGISPDVATFVCVLKSCGSIGAADKGQEIHTKILRDGLLKKSNIVGNALVDMYAKCGLLAKAQEVFDKLLFRDVVSWNALMAGYTHYGQGKKALECFARMKLDGLAPDAITYICILKACSSIGAADKAKKIHAEIDKEGLLEKDISVGNALVDMYTKYGMLAKAQEVFDKLPIQNMVTWNSLMAGYALLGKSEDVFHLFDKMIEEGIRAGPVTFTVLLNACSNTGLLDKGQMYFETMSTCYGVVPTLEHHTCMVDLYARAGHIDKAMRIIQDMPFSADFTVWLTLLSACRKWGKMRLGRLAFEHAVRLDEREAAAYVCMRNLYAAAGRQEAANKVEALRVKNRAWKEPGYCWTDSSGIAHSFLVWD